jgi:hypothetical protein
VSQPITAGTSFIEFVNNFKSNKMKRGMSLIFAGLLMLGTISCQDKNQEILEKGDEISGKLVKAIMAKLTAEIQENGLPGAIGYCSVYAIPITDSISKSEQVIISRVSHKPRNPLNAANSIETEMIGNYILQQNEGKQLLPQVVTAKGKKTYYAPVVLGSPVCLSCHGELNSIDEKVRKVIAEKYPDDKAVDFNLNEIRGMFKIEFGKERE